MAAPGLREDEEGRTRRLLGRLLAWDEVDEAVGNARQRAAGAGLSLQEAAAVYAYTFDRVALPLNAALRGGGMTAAQTEYAALLDRALDRLPVYDDIVSRAISDRGETFRRLERLAAGEVLSVSGFVSASFNPRPPMPGNIHFWIRSRSGRLIADVTKYAGEGEVLFRRGLQYRVRSVSKAATGDAASLHLELDELAPYEWLHPSKVALFAMQDHPDRVDQVRKERQAADPDGIVAPPLAPGWILYIENAAQMLRWREGGFDLAAAAERWQAVWAIITSDIPSAEKTNALLQWKEREAWHLRNEGVEVEDPDYFRFARLLALYRILTGQPRDPHRIPGYRGPIWPGCRGASLRARGAGLAMTSSAAKSPASLRARGRGGGHQSHTGAVSRLFSRTRGRGRSRTW